MIDTPFPAHAPKGKKITREISIVIAHASLAVVHARCNEIRRALERVDIENSFKPGIDKVTFHGAVIR